MAAVMTYNSLKEDLQRYLERGSPSDTEVFEQIPRLIGLAERSIATALKIQGFINVVTANLVAGTSVYAKPDRWRETISMFYGSGVGSAQERVPIFTRSYEYCRAYWPNSTLQDVPKYYADYDYFHWLIVPTPVTTVPWEISYYQLPPLLEDANQTNWLTDYMPNALLYRSLLEATPFLKEDERIDTWKQMFGEAMSNIDQQDMQKVVDRAGVRQKD